MTAQKQKQVEKEETGLVERDTSKRPDLPPEFKKRVDEIKKAAEDKMFFSFDEGDTVAVTLISRDLIPSKVGENPAWLARYHEGNVHGTGGGAPQKKGQIFRFWETSVLASKFRELNVGPERDVVISCLGDKEGKSFTYKDFIVEPLMSEPPQSLES